MTCYLSDKATKVFTETFVESVKTLYEASLAGKEMRLKAFKHFVNEFGKDLNIFFSQNSTSRVVGLKVEIFTNYFLKSFPLALTTPPSPSWAQNSPLKGDTQPRSGLRNDFYDENICNQERGSSNTGELEECNTLVGSKIFGFQAEMARYNCTKDNLLSKGSSSLLSLLSL